MLSIVVPHYNFNNETLFKEIERQCLNLHLIFEIIIIDDASLPQHKTYLAQFKAAHYKIILLEKNKGRAAVRNYLATLASYPYLLFLDGDSEITNPNFIKNYISYLQQKPQADIICGSRIYPTSEKSKATLHDHYGIKQEIPAAKYSFHSNNFLIKKEIFSTLKFDESLTQYGYEDVLFGLSAKSKGYTIENFNNPVLHLQLKNNQEFIADTDDAIQNLAKLLKQEKYALLLKDVSLVRNYYLLRKTGLLGFMNHFRPLLRRQLEKERPHLFSIKKLQLYKLLLLHHFLS